MAEMLVRVVDRSNNDPLLDARLTKRGDVIAICDDGHAWSALERSGTPWIIVRVPGATVADLSAFVAEEPQNAANPHRLLRVRAFSFNLAAHQGASMTLQQALALKSPKPPLPDPAVL